nr:type VII secretion target [Kibdelosporangium sp. MJ126-NF4]CEL23645.1 hypothetical protein [Kibdelosporangium sp. MJ126-NF4]CTQ93181.1 hypothetical protein [Kibdelosporangium sp. MJ126-NF4]
MAGKTEIKPDEVRAVAADIEAMGAAFDKVAQFAGQNACGAEHFGRIVGKSDVAGKAFKAAADGLAESLAKAGAGFVKGVAATLKTSADKHGGTEKTNKQNLANADGGA